MFVKDSSANKCGVITSSYEILLSMMLSTPEFLQHKETFVPQLLHKLRTIAETEARLIFREMRLDSSKPFPVVSSEVSAQITRLHDALDSAIGSMDEQQFAGLEHVLARHLPPGAAEDLPGGFAERLDRVPRQYRNATIACVLASQMVYKEGVGFIAALPEEGLAQLALRYAEAERQVGEELLPALRASDMAPELLAQAEAVLGSAGARVAMAAA